MPGRHRRNPHPNRKSGRFARKNNRFLEASSSIGPAAPHNRLKIWVLGLRLAPTVVWSTAVYAAYTYLGAGLILSGYPADKMAEAILLYGCGSIVGILAGGRLADQFGYKLEGSKNPLNLAAHHRLLGLGERGIGNGGAIGIF
jgi:hypothetical protein